jgi:hypothetical protein
MSFVRLFVSWGAGDHACGLEHARQVLCHRVTFPAPVSVLIEAVSCSANRSCDGHVLCNGWK